MGSIARAGDKRPAIQAHGYAPGDVLLCIGYEGIQSRPQGRPPHAVVDQFSVLQRKVCFEVQSIAVDGHVFEFAMGMMKDDARGRN